MLLVNLQELYYAFELYLMSGATSILNEFKHVLV
jgi:hypothetical protein